MLQPLVQMPLFVLTMKSLLCSLLLARISTLAALLHLLQERAAGCYVHSAHSAQMGRSGLEPWTLAL